MTSRLLTGASIAALLALGALSLTSSRAEVVDPTIAVSAYGSANARWSSDRGGGARRGSVPSLPMTPHQKWSKNVSGRIDWPVVVDGDGNVIAAVAPSAGGEGQLVELAALTGAPKSVTKLRTPTGDLDGLGPLNQDAAASAPVLLNSGLRVVVTIRGYAIGIAPGGAIMFRTRLASELASVPRVGLAPLPGGGFAVSRRPELIEVDAKGTVVDRVRVDVAPFIAARDNGEVLAVNNTGELYSWRAHRIPRLIGTFGEKVTTADGVCRGGLAIDGSSEPGGRRERAICVSEGLVEQIDIATGARKALLPKLPVPYRTAPGISARGDLAVAIAGGTLLGIAALGNDVGPFDIPGSVPLAFGKDGGVAYVPSLGEVAPLVADDGAIAWGSSDGVAIVRSGIVTKFARCGGSFGSSTTGLASAGAGTVVVACSDGKVELYSDK
jgi:hypothetical protein